MRLEKEGAVIAAAGDSDIGRAISQDAGTKVLAVLAMSRGRRCNKVPGGGTTPSPVAKPIGCDTNTIER